MTQSWKPAFPGDSTWCSPARLPRHKAWIWCCAPCWMPALPGAENLHLLLVGDGMSRESLQALAEELHAGDAVTFYGSVPAEKVPSFTTLADALLISLSDSPDLGLTVPGKLASYMAAGKPVVASMNGAGYEAVKESGGGLVSPACDQAALAANLLALYRMAPEGRALPWAAKAKAYYEAHYRPH